ncbi:MAG: hypothetical protein RRZ24_04240 [Clostridia bacterium]
MKKIIMALITFAWLFIAGCFPALNPVDSKTSEMVSPPAVAESPAPFHSPNPARDTELLTHTQIAGHISNQQVLAVMRYLDGKFMSACDPQHDYLSWLASFDDRPVRFYRSLPFGQGALVLAMEPGDGETDAELFYVVDDVVIAQTDSADCWSVDMVRFLDKTIVFGTSFAYESDTTDITATFFDGQQVSQSLLFQTKQPGMSQGYILVADGMPDLQTISIANNGVSVSDQEEFLFGLGCANYAWAGTPCNIFYITHLCTFVAAGQPKEPVPQITLSGNASGICDFDFSGYSKEVDHWKASDAWRNNNALYCSTSVSVGTVLTMNHLPADITRAYLVFPEFDDGTEAGINRAVEDILLQNNSITIPDLTGHTEIRFVIETPTTANVLTLSVH